MGAGLKVGSDFSASGFAPIKWRAISGLCNGRESDVLKLDWVFVA